MSKQPGSTFRSVVCVCALLCAATTARAADSRERIERVVNDLKTQLSIEQTIDVAVVAENPKLFSVTPAEQQPRTFLLSVEEHFAQELSDAELRAAVAHELGHVWIYTHFPYLQTEQLANDIASRVVSPDSLAPLYEKVWKKAAVQ